MKIAIDIYITGLVPDAEVEVAVAAGRAAIVDQTATVALAQGDLKNHINPVTFPIVSLAHIYSPHTTMNPRIKNILYALCLVLSMCFHTEMCAQTQNIRFEVRIKDAFSRLDLPQAKVLLFEADSVTQIDAVVNRKTATQASSSGIQKVVTTFYITAPIRTRYIAKVSMEGYMETCAFIDVQKSKNGLVPKEVTLKDVLLHKEFATQDLGEATVTASRVAMIMKGDTVEYDARAFRLAEGSLLNKLFQILPGVKIDANGVITLNGERVKKLLLNGNNFFNGDARMALDNLPAYIVDKVKFYHEGPKWEYLLDDKDSYHGKKPLVVDVRLKRDYNAGWIMNAEMAGGSKLKDADKMLYLARLFALRYTENSTFSAFGTANNLGDSQSPGRKGEWKRMNSSMGERDSRTGGANLTLHGKRTDTDFNGSIVVTNEDMNVASGSTSLMRYGTSQTRSLSNSARTTNRTSIRWNSDLMLKQKNAYTSIFTKINYLHNNGRSDNDYVSDMESGEQEKIWKRTYSRLIGSNSCTNSWNAFMAVNSTVKGPWSHKLYEIIAQLSYNTNNTTEMRRDTYENASSTGWEELRRDVKPLKSYFYYLGVSRNIMNITTKRGWRLSADLNYMYGQKFSRDARNRNLCDTIGMSQTTLLPSATADDVWVHDYQNSLHTTEFSRSSRFHLFLQLKRDGITWINIIDYVLSKRYIYDLRNLQTTNLKHDDSSWDINSELEFSKAGVSIRYRLIPDYAGSSSLIQGNNASDPLYVYNGNPNLKNPMTNRVTLTKSFRKPKHNSMFSISAIWENTKDAIAQTRTYDAETGAVTSQAVNVNGNWRSIGSLSYSQSLDKKKRWDIYTGSDLKFSRTIDFSYTSLDQFSVRAKANEWTWTHELRLDFKSTKGYIFAAQATASYKAYHSHPLESRINNGIWDYTYGVSLQVPIGKDFIFSTDMMAYAHRKYYDENMNKTEWVWNAEIEYSVGKKKKWVIRAVGFDLLHQQSSIERITNPQGYTETWCNTTPSFATLDIIYRFNKTPKKNK